MSRPPGTRRQTQGKAARGPGGNKRPAADSRGACPTSISGTDISTAGIFGTGIPRTDISSAGIVRTDIPRTRPCSQSRQAPTRQAARLTPSDKKSDSSHKGKNRFFIRPGAIGTNRRDKGQAPRQGEAPPTPAAGYSYCPDLRRSTSSRVRKRQAPRLRFFFVRPA